MKRYVTLFFALSLLLILGACGGKDDGQIAANAPDNGTESPMINTSRHNGSAPPESAAPEEVDGGGRFGQSLTAITKLAPDAVLGEGPAINYSGGSKMPDDVSDWLNENDIAAG